MSHCSCAVGSSKQSFHAHIPWTPGSIRLSLVSSPATSSEPAPSFISSLLCSSFSLCLTILVALSQLIYILCELEWPKLCTLFSKSKHSGFQVVWPCVLFCFLLLYWCFLAFCWDLSVWPCWQVNWWFKGLPRSFSWERDNYIFRACHCRYILKGNFVPIHFILHLSVQTFCHLLT